MSLRYILVPIHVKNLGNWIRIRKIALSLSIYIYIYIYFRDEDPEPFSRDPDPTCNNGFLKLFSF